MQKSLFLLFVLHCACITAGCDSFFNDAYFPLEVQTESGALQDQRGITSLYFKGVPYAEAPVNDLRWEAPADKRPWEGVLSTHAFSAICPQLLGDDDTADGDEDCLYLNIYRPKAPRIPLLRLQPSGPAASCQTGLPGYQNFLGMIVFGQSLIIFGISDTYS